MCYVVTRCVKHFLMVTYRKSHKIFAFPSFNISLCFLYFILTLRFFCCSLPFLFCRSLWINVSTQLFIVVKGFSNMSSQLWEHPIMDVFTLIWGLPFLVYLRREERRVIQRKWQCWALWFFCHSQRHARLCQSFQPKWGRKIQIALFLPLPFLLEVGNWIECFFFSFSIYMGCLLS